MKKVFNTIGNILGIVIAVFASAVICVGLYKLLEWMFSL